MANTYTIFISHSWKYDSKYNDLRNLLDKRTYFSYEALEATKNTPINSENATYIKKVLKVRIKNSIIVLALAGIYASYSEWMKWEIDTALELGIPIVGVAPWGQINLSQYVVNGAVEIVRWNTEPIVTAIRKHAKN